MILIYLNDIIDFHNKQFGAPKFTKVRQIFERPPYHPAFDFYKPIRDAIVSNVREDEELTQLLEFLDSFKDSKKEGRYSRLIPGCVKFFKRRNMRWFTPPTNTWIYKSLCVKVNPELGLFINGIPYIIKLHFKETPLKQSDITTMVRMMEKTLATGIYTGYRCAILDLERSKLHEISSQMDPLLDILLEAEADSFIKLWNELERKSA